MPLFQYAQKGLCILSSTSSFNSVFTAYHRCCVMHWGVSHSEDAHTLSLSFWGVLRCLWSLHADNSLAPKSGTLIADC
eukprot:1545080-Amphidinium_carterae.2